MKLNLAYIFLCEFSFSFALLFFFNCTLHKGEGEKIGFQLQDSHQTCRTYISKEDFPYPMT